MLVESLSAYAIYLHFEPWKSISFWIHEFYEMVHETSQASYFSSGLNRLH